MACALCAPELQTPVLRASRPGEGRRLGREQIEAIAAAVAED